MSEKGIDIFKINETLTYKFYQMPKELFANPYYKDKLSVEAKVVYTLLLDRLQISKMNKWFNENGEIYLIYTRKEIIDELNISKTTATNIFKELVNCNLIREERLGQGMPNRIYIGKIKHEEMEEYKNRIFRSPKTRLQEVQNSISRSLKEYLNNTNKNNNNINKYLVAENVNLFGEELKALVDKYGIVKAAKIVNELSLYKFSSGKEYPNDYEVINRWVINKVERDEKIENNKKAIRKYKNYSQREYNGFEQFYDNL